MREGWVPGGRAASAYEVSSSRPQRHACLLPAVTFFLAFHGLIGMTGRGVHAAAVDEAQVASAGPGEEGKAAQAWVAANAKAAAEHGEWWVDRLAKTGRWSITKNYKGVRGATVVADKASFACFMVLQDVCHFTTKGVHHSGHWYSLQGVNLAPIYSAEDICGFSGRKLHYPFTPFHINHYERAECKLGVLLSKEKRRELESSMEIKEAAAGEEVKFTEPQPPATGAAGSGNRTQVVRRLNRALVVVSPHDGAAGHFCERVGGLAEISVALAAELGEGVPESERGKRHGTMLRDVGTQLGGDWASVMLFPRDITRQISVFAGNVSRLLFGLDTVMVPGRGRPFDSHECFPNAVLPLNQIYSQSAATTFSAHAHRWAKVERACAARPGMDNKSSIVTSPVALQPPQLQVTWVFRGGTRVMLNPGALLSLLMSIIRLPISVVSFSSSTSFLEIVETMQRTAVLIGMHGGAFGNVVLMPEGASVVEVLPYKCEYGPYKFHSEAFGLLPHQWINTREDSAVFEDPCLKPEWRNLTAAACWAFRACRECVRDKSKTLVNVGEMTQLLEKVRTEVDAFALSLLAKG